jgi:hypothetical protein
MEHSLEHTSQPWRNVMQIYDSIRTMQVIMRLVATGSCRYTSGTVRHDRADALAAKFAVKYDTHGGRAVDARARRAGRARTRLVMLARPDDLAFDWWLVASAGDGSVVDQERLQDANDRRARIRLGLFELVRLTAPVDGSRWTWRMPVHDFEDLRSHGRQLATHASVKQAQDLVDWSRHWPGFRGIREQRYALWRDMQASRAGAQREDALVVPDKTPWPRLLKLAGHGTSLVVAMAKMRAVVAGGSVQN